MIKDIIQIFLDSKDPKGIPNLDPKKWKELNGKYDKETIISALIEYIKTYHPSPPINSITEQEMIRSFVDLRKPSWKKFYLPHEEIKDRVLEKYNDYKYPYLKYGLGIIQMGNAYIDVSNHFNQTLRMECDTYGFKGAHHRWKNTEDLRTVFLALWRLDNDRLNERSLVGAFRLSTYIATQFKPHVAKTIYDMTSSKVIFDSSCGWGDRLAGFYCSDATHYYGCDPNDQTFEMYKKQCLMYEKILGSEPHIAEWDKDYFTAKGKKEVHIWRCPAEDLDYSILPKIDCAFTSPPYFSTELYNSRGKHVADQSWKRYDTYEKWRDNFYLPVNEKTFEKLKDGGIQIVNIMDPKVKGTRYYASDHLIDEMTKYKDCRFIGQLGMRIMTRPRNIPKTTLLQLYEKAYIEPMWAFGKNRKTLIIEEGGKLEAFMT